MDTYPIGRAQLSLMSEERRALDAEAARTGRSVSGLLDDLRGHPEAAARALPGTLTWHAVDWDGAGAAGGSAVSGCRAT